MPSGRAIALVTAARHGCITDARTTPAPRTDSGPGDAAPTDAAVARCDASVQVALP
jgi:hypothetical protein